MPNYGTTPAPAPAPAPPAPPADKRLQRRLPLLAALAAAAVAIACVLALHVRAPRARVTAGNLVRVASHRLVDAVAHAAGKRFRPFGRFGGPDAETVRRVFELRDGARGVLHTGRAGVARGGQHGWWHQHGHNHRDQHKHGHHHHARGWRAFFSGPLGHPRSHHDFNYACDMPALTPCVRACHKTAHALRWPCLMRCARAQCFVIGASCGQSAFDKCAAQCAGTGSGLVPCAKKCFAGICPVKKA